MSLRLATWTALLLQSIQTLLDSGVPPANILYTTFDHPLLKLAGIDAVLEAWRAREPKVEGPEYLFLDEAQFIRDWGTWVKHQVDFRKDRRIAFTGSAIPLTEAGQESGVGRWHTIRLMREDIIDKVLKRDMTALYGVRRVLELEQTFLYLCMHDGGLLDMIHLCENLEVKRPEAQHFIERLESTHLIYRLPPFGYGKEVLRGKFKIYLSDAALAPAVLLKGKTILEDPIALGTATETSALKHLFARYYTQDVRFSYWRGKKDREVDLVAEVQGQIIPFEVKYRSQHTGIRELKGLIELCQQKSVDRAYVITKSLSDFGPMEDLPQDQKAQIMRIPAPLLCYWMGAMELDREAGD